MYLDGGDFRIPLTDLVVFSESEFTSWMDRWLVDEDKSSPLITSAVDRLEPTPDQEDLQTLIFAKKGM